jgi:hypothetical protein
VNIFIPPCSSRRGKVDFVLLYYKVQAKIHYPWPKYGKYTIFLGSIDLYRRVHVLYLNALQYVQYKGKKILWYQMTQNFMSISKNINVTWLYSKISRFLKEKLESPKITCFFFLCAFLLLRYVCIFEIQ